MLLLQDGVEAQAAPLVEHIDSQFSALIDGQEQLDLSFFYKDGTVEQGSCAEDELVFLVELSPEGVEHFVSGFEAEPEEIGHVSHDFHEELLIHVRVSQHVLLQVRQHIGKAAAQVLKGFSFQGSAKGVVECFDRGGAVAICNEGYFSKDGGHFVKHPL